MLQNNTTFEVDTLLEELCAKAESAKIAALKLRKRNQEVRSAEEKRDNALYLYLARASRLVVKERALARHDLRVLRNAKLSVWLPKMKALKKCITQRALRTTDPTLGAGTRAKYKRKDQTFLDFLEAHGGIDECVQRAIMVREQQRRARANRINSRMPWIEQKMKVRRPALIKRRSWPIHFTAAPAKAIPNLFQMRKLSTSHPMPGRMRFTDPNNVTTDERGLV